MILGIDTGAHGAVAYFDDSGVLLDIEDMPTDKVQVGKNLRERVSDIRLLDMLSDIPAGSQAYLERPEGRPIRYKDKQTGGTLLRQPGAAGMLSLGEAYGMTRCACIAKGIAITEIRAGIWKRGMGVSGNKDECRRRASELFPTFTRFFARVKDDGRAESVLIGLWASRELGKIRA